jgi:hypothetical protein
MAGVFHVQLKDRQIIFATSMTHNSVFTLINESTHVKGGTR